MLSRVNIQTDASGLRVAVVVSRYHESITSVLEEGAASAFLDMGGAEQDLLIVDAPGTYELVALCRALVMTDRPRPFDAVVALGCVITGETTHDQYINHAVSSALADLTVISGTPIAFGVLTCQTMAQAEARAGGDKGNKGAEAMTAAVAAVGQVRRLDEAASTATTEGEC